MPPCLTHGVVERVDRCAGQAKRLRRAFQFQDLHGRVDRAHFAHCPLTFWPESRSTPRSRGRVVQPAIPLRPQRSDQLGGDCAQRDDHLLGSRRVQHDAHVLVVQVDSKAGFELARQHAGPLAVQHRAAGKSARQHLKRRLGVHAVRPEKDNGLGYQLIVSGDDQLIRGLDCLAGARWAHQHNRAAHGLENGFHLVEVGRFGADHDRQLRLPSPGFPAADWGVHNTDTGFLAGLRQLHRYVRADGGHIDVNRTLLRIGVDPVLV